MNLQSALILLGLFVIGLVYLMSTWHDKYQPLLASRKPTKKPRTKVGVRNDYDSARDSERASEASQEESLDIESTTSNFGGSVSVDPSVGIDSPADIARRKSRSKKTSPWRRWFTKDKSAESLPPPTDSNDGIGPYSDSDLNEAPDDAWTVDDQVRFDHAQTDGAVPSLSTEHNGSGWLGVSEKSTTEVKKVQIHRVNSDLDPIGLVDEVGTESPEPSAVESGTFKGEIDEFSYAPVEGFEKISQVDYWVKIVGERDVGRESVLGIYRDSISSITKTSNIFGLRLPERTWCDLELESEEARFGDIVVTVQLADKIGGISESEMTRFSVLVSNLSEKTGRGFSFMAPIECAMEQSRSIAEFVRHFDSVFIINIKPRESIFFDGATIHRCALQIGLERSTQNFYVRNKPVGKRNICLYSLANMSETGEFDFDDIGSQSIKGVTFFIYPAKIRYPGAVFAEMVDTAKAFAARIKGDVSMPGREELSNEDVDAIRRSIEESAMKMDVLGIASGSEEAIKIF